MRMLSTVIAPSIESSRASNHSAPMPKPKTRSKLPSRISVLLRMSVLPSEVDVNRCPT